MPDTSKPATNDLLSILIICLLVFLFLFELANWTFAAKAIRRIESMQPCRPQQEQTK